MSSLKSRTRRPWRGQSMANMSGFSLSCPRDLRGVGVPVVGVDPQPRGHVVGAALAVDASTLPLLDFERLEQLSRGRANTTNDLERRIDGPVVVQPLGEALLVVGRDDRLILGQQRAQTEVRGGLAVGEVVDDLACRPGPRGRAPVELVVGG